MGIGGKYRRTSSPSVCTTPNVKPSVAALNPNKSPVKTPKRESPATIAAKGAPGWEKFLGVKSQTVSFTSEEATKFRAARDESRSRNSGKTEEMRRGGEARNNKNLLNNFFHKMEENKQQPQ